MTTLRVAEVGLGWVATNRHLPAMRQHGGFEVLGVVDRRDGIAARVAERHRIRFHHCGASLSSIPWIDSVDAVVIATSPYSHFDVARQAIELGKHVLTEKPFAMTVDEGQQLVRLAEQRQRVLGVVHNFQFARSALTLRADLASGRLGRVRGLIASQYGNPERRLPSWIDNLPLGLFYDESPHLLYLLRCFAPGPLHLVSCEVFPNASGGSTPALVHATYDCLAGANRIPVSLALHFDSPVSEWFLTVLGEHGLGVIDIFRDIYVFLPNDREHAARHVLRTSMVATWAHWVQHLTQGTRHLTGRLLYGNEEIFARFHAAAVAGRPLSAIGAADALEVLRMQHDILERACRL